MYRGRYRQGDWVPLLCWCRNAAGTPALPDDAPYAEIWSAAGTKIATVQIPIVDRAAITGLFLGRVQLTGSYGTAGTYRVVYRYTIGSYVGVDEDSFDVVAGGSATGTVIAMAVYVRPQATFVLRETDDGQLLINKNPRL